jgi:hypothetical protein
MLICESYLLIYLEKWKHKKSIALGQDGIFCLAGAGIMDLILREKLMLDGKRIKLIDTNPTGVAFLDEILTMVKESKKVRKLYGWIIRIGGKHYVDRINLVFKSLENQGILQFEWRVAAKIFYKWNYNFIKPELIQSLLQQVQNAFIDSGIEPEIELLCLLNLLRQSRLFSMCISKEYRNLVKHRMEQLLLFGNYDPSHIELIKLVKKAIKSALTSDLGLEAIPF